MSPQFDPPATDRTTQEEDTSFAPRFDEAGLVTAVVTDDENGTLLMVAHMNAEALELTVERGVAHFYSRSRKMLWKKGEISGNLLHVTEIRTDCDQDCIWIRATVGGQGVACHTGRRSCFYRRVVGGSGGTRLIAD